MRWAGHVAHMGKGEVYTVFWWGKPEEKYQLEDPGIDGRMILRCIFRKCDGGMCWIDLTQNRDRCWELVNAVTNLWVP